VIAGAGSISVYLYLYPGRLTRLKLLQLFFVAAIPLLNISRTVRIGHCFSKTYLRKKRAVMASRVLLQRGSGRGALRVSPRVSAPSTSYLANYSTTRSNGTNINANTLIANVTSINAIKFKMNDTRNQKYFSTSTSRTKELATMSEDEISGLKVKEDRLMRDLHETCEWGKGEVWGR
jgi:hypothetical protein